MNALTQTNFGLTSRGLLPIDGQCVCDGCNATGLNRDQVYKYSQYSNVCATCLPLWTHGERDTCTCGKDKINHSGPLAFVECYSCANNPKPKLLSDIADDAAPLPDNDAFYDLMEAGEVKHGLGHISLAHQDDEWRDYHDEGDL